MVGDDAHLLKRFKSDHEEGFSLRTIPGYGHCITNYFAVHFNEPLDLVLDRLDTKVRENIYYFTKISQNLERMKSSYKSLSTLQEKAIIIV